MGSRSLSRKWSHGTVLSKRITMYRVMPHGGLKLGLAMTSDTSTPKSDDAVCADDIGSAKS